MSSIRRSRFACGLAAWLAAPAALAQVPYGPAAYGPGFLPSPVAPGYGGGYAGPGYGPVGPGYGPGGNLPPAYAPLYVPPASIPPGGYGPPGYGPGGPGYPQPNYYGAPGYAPPGYGPSGYGMPGYGPSGYGTPGYGPDGQYGYDVPPAGPAQNDPVFGPNAAPLPPGQPPAQRTPQRPFSPDIPNVRPLAVRDYSWTYIDAPSPRQIMLHDIVTILVDEKAELIVQNRFNRQRNATYKAQLKEFLRLDDNLNLDIAAAKGPGINATLQGRMQSYGQLADTEGIRYRIAATVVGVLPNGNVVLEARKTIRSNDGMWEYTLTGTIASRDVRVDYTAVSENVANLQIEKRQRGKLADSAQRPWGMWLYDKLSPF